jgi:hypothetical protein
MQRAGHLKRRKEIFDLKGGSILPTLGGEQKIGFAADTSKAIGMKKSSINKSIARAEKIPEDIQERISGTEIEDSGVELDAIAKLDHDDLDRQLWEIDENLMRAELTELQQAGHLKRRKEIFDLKTGGSISPTSLSDGRGAGPQHQKAFASETATATGMGKATAD